MFCKFCGSQIDDDSVFCFECGNEINSKSSESNIDYLSNDTETNLYTHKQLTRQRQAEKIAKVIPMFIILIIIVALLTAVNPTAKRAFTNNNKNTSTQNQISESNVSNQISKALITYDEYLQIKSNMTYDDACKIIGSYGREMSRAEYGGYQTVVVTWEGYGTIGANAVITFQNGKVSAKSQIGLE